MISLMAASRPASLAEYQPAAASHAEAEDMSLQDATDAATVMFLLMLKGEQSNDRCGELRADGQSKLRAQEADRELADRTKEILARHAAGFFDGIAELVADAFKAWVTGNYDQLDKDAKALVASPNFWGDLQKVAAVVAEVASAVVSGVTLGAGSASVVAVTAFVVGTVLSTAGMVEENFHVVEKLTNDPEFAKWFAIGCMVGSAVCGLTGAIANGVSAAAREGARAAVSEGVKQAAEQAAKDPSVWTKLKSIASTTQTISNLISAAAEVPSAVIQYDLDQTNIDVTKAAQKQQLFQEMIRDILDQLNTRNKQSEKDLNAARAAISVEQDTQLVAASILRA